MNRYLEPLRERRREYQKRPDYVKQVLDQGGRQARAIAKNTIGEVYEKMGLGQYP